MRLIFLLLFTSSLFASPEQGKTEGEALANALRNKSNIQESVNKANKHGYELEKEKHKSWQQNQNISEGNLHSTAVKKELEEEVGQHISSMHKERARFDEMLEDSLLSNQPEYESIEDMDGKTITIETSSEYTEHECQHSRAAEEYTCTQTLNEPTVTINEEKWGEKEVEEDRGRKWHRLSKKKPKKKKVKYKISDRKVTISTDVWTKECEHLEKRAECKQIEAKCLDNKSRIINGETVSKACWKYSYTYSCKYPERTSCRDYIKKGCEPLNSTCKLKEGDKCYIWQQKYRCPKDKKQTSHTIKDFKFYCSSGDCFDQKEELNDEMPEAVSNLSIFSNMQKDNQITNNKLNIFTGSSEGCNKFCVNFKDCCETKGWGVNSGLARCSSQEMLLADKRNRNLCVRVGTFCAEKVPLTGVCLREKTNFCCYKSQLAKIVQEEGRRQLGIGFGTAKEPSCGGFTQEDLSRIDFSKLDLKPFFESIKTKRVDYKRLEATVKNKLAKIQRDHKIQQEGNK